LGYLRSSKKKLLAHLELSASNGNDIGNNMFASPCWGCGSTNQEKLATQQIILGQRKGPGL
jgi:hypothetical protein